MGNHIFKRRKTMKNGNLVFTCSSCSAAGHYLSAVVKDEGNDNYSVVRAPQSSEHECWVTGWQDLIKSAREEMCETVLRDPTRGLKDVYEDVRGCYTKNMDHNTKLLFCQDLPTFPQIKQSMLRKRREVIPADPRHMIEADIDLDLFKLDGENVVKLKGIKSLMMGGG